MNIINELNILLPVNGDTEIKEDINSFSIKYNILTPPQINTIQIKEFLKNIPTGDLFKLRIQTENNDPIIFKEKTEIESYLKSYRTYFQHYESSEIIYLSLEIDKTNNLEIRHIYNQSSFLKFWDSKNTIEILEILNSLFMTHEYVFFKYLEPDLHEILTTHICFGYDKKSIKHQTCVNLRQENSHFGNSQQYPVVPEFFKILHETKVCPISKKLNVLTSLFSIISLFDITSIKDDNLLFKLNGYKSFEDSIKIDDSFLNCSETYYQIYEWVYSSTGNITDKIGLVRNILSIYLEDDITNLDKNILLSIRSAYKTYLKENVSKYLEIRNKIFDELSWISQKSSEIVDKYLGSYQKSILTFLSFFISVFVIRVLNTHEFTNVFPKDATLLSFAFLLISVGFLYVSQNNLKSEKKRLNRKYNNIKSRYKDLLIEKDIEKILDNDNEFNYEISFIDTKLKSYTRLWVYTLLILLIFIITISDHINWNTIYTFLNNAFHKIIS